MSSIEPMCCWTNQELLLIVSTGLAATTTSNQATEAENGE